MSGRRILVTGGGGFIGSNVVKSLARGENRVVAIDNLSRGILLRDSSSSVLSRANWERLAHLPNVTAVKGDVTDARALAHVISDVDAVVHTAAQVAVTSSVLDPVTDFRVNVQGTLTLLEAARLARGAPPVLYTSTNKVYGSNVNRLRIRESGGRYVFADPEYRFGIPSHFPIDASEHSPYGVSKLAADQYVRDYSSTYGIKTMVFRMSCIYGLGQSGNEDQGWLAHFARSMLRNRPITIYGDGKQVRDVLDVRDLVRAIKAGLRKLPSLSGSALNIGGGPDNTLSLLELIDQLERLMGTRAKMRSGPWRPGDQRVYVSDIRRAAQELGWKPRIRPAAGVSHLVSWLNTPRARRV